ncbi:MAG: prolyl oligopeptidase family serine peptidase [Bryobacteraceae bacterium]
MNSKRIVILLALAVLPAMSQTRARDLVPILEHPVQAQDVVSYQLRQYMYRRVTPLVAPQTAAQWTAESERIRKHLLDDVVYHGWPKSWVESSPKFEDLGTVESGPGYRVHKLRYEVVPGFQSTAILYEPEKMSGKLPAILNPNGHELVLGKAAEYKQKRCINFAKRGIIALSLEWLYCGELHVPENKHEFAAHLDLVGANGVGLFYLAMRRGLDYLYDLPTVDRSRIGVTGLSGGGWQTIVLSSLDPRVAVSVPVAGYSALVSKLERVGDYGDNEQVPQDFLEQQDYTHLTAIRAPRPTLVIHNAEDDCCFRAPLVKPYIYDQVKPIFALYDKESVFGWHENVDPSTHNYQLDNRLQAYRFFSKQFGMAPVEAEIPVASEIKSYQELTVGLPQDNLTILGVARKMAQDIQRPSAQPAESRIKLKSVVRYQPVALEHAWALTNTKDRGVETRTYQFVFANGLSAAGVWSKAISTSNGAPATIILNDKGKKASAGQVSDHLNRGQQVLALDLLFTGDAAPKQEDFEEYPLLLATTGQRALGAEAAQLIAMAGWLKTQWGAKDIRLNSTGIRNQVAALVAADMEPRLFSEVAILDGMPSLKYLLDKPVKFESAPDLFCLDLFKDFDLDQMAAMAAPSKVMTHVIQ